VIARIRHLHDERLYDCYYATCTGELADPLSAEHLADCPKCSARYAELAGLLDGLRTEADASADEVFTPERLRAQQQQIEWRLESVGRSARVLSFPAHFGNRHADTGVSRLTKRWAAAAAAAGLFIGIGTGIFLQSGSRAERSTGTVNSSEQRAAAPRAAAPKVAGAVGSPSDSADDEFMSELELALDRPLTRELLPFDALTPYVLETANQVR
jgi:anti-sigma factor RsiW